MCSCASPLSTETGISIIIRLCVNVEFFRLYNLVGSMILAQFVEDMFSLKTIVHFAKPFAISYIHSKFSKISYNLVDSFEVR